MQTEERSICPSCGGDNPKEVSFCWRCYANLSPTPVAPGRIGEAGAVPNSYGRLGVQAMPSPPSMPAPQTSRSGPSTIARIAVGAVASLVAVFGVRAVFDSGPSLPDVVAGTPRITSQEIDDFEKQMVEYGEDADLGVAAGAYGTGAVPTFVVLLVEARTVEATDDIFSQFVEGMTTGGATVASATERGERDGVEYRCVPVVAQQIEAAACMWRDDATVGIVLRLDGGIDETKDLLFRAHDELV